MKKTLSILSLSLIFAPALAFASEADQVQARIAQTGYPLPMTTIQQLEQIEAELTPAADAKSWQSLSEDTSGWFCDQETIQLSYRLDTQSPIEVFTARFFHPAKGTKWPAIVIQPTLAGPSILEKKIAADLCRSGFASIVPNETMLDLPAQLPDFSAYDRNMRIEMIRARRMVDVLTERADIDASAIGTIGFSRGAIAGALLMGIEPRIKYGFLGAGAMGLGRVIARSTTERGSADNLRHRTAAGMTPEQFEEKLIQTFRYDGLLFAHRVPSHHVKIMVIAKDTNVITEGQELLQRSFRMPLTVYREGSHVNAIIKEVVFHPSDYLGFFKYSVRQIREGSF